MSFNAYAPRAPADWPTEEPDDEFARAVGCQPERAFAVLFGACVIVVATDGSVTIRMLPAWTVLYLRTGKPHPTMGSRRWRR